MILLPRRTLHLVATVFLTLARLTTSGGAAPVPSRAAAEAASAVVAAGFLEYSAGGQARTFELAADEVAVPRRETALAGVPADATPLGLDSQHAFFHLPAGMSVSALVAAEAQRGARATAPGLPPVESATFRPVFYERGRLGVPAARRVATADLLLIGVAGPAARAAALATGAVGIPQEVTADMPVLRYASAWEMLAAARALQAQGLEVAPQLTHVLMKRTAPNDPLYDQQFYFKNTGQGGGRAGEDLNIEGLWPAASGAGVTIAVVDDGLEITHPDLAPNVPSLDSALHRNVLDENGDPTPPAEANHGTICAGFIAARGGNGIGMTGAAPLARLLGVRLLGAGKNGDSATDVQEAAAFGWRPDVVNISSNSWGPNDDGATVSAPEAGALAAMRAAVTTGRGGKGVVYFVAAGNGRDSGDHAGYDGYSGSRFVLAIGATDNRGKQAPFSESGPQLIACAAGQTSEGEDVQLLATDNVGARGVNKAASPEGDYTTSGTQGTSYSTPQAAGVAALMLQANSTLGWRDVKEILVRTARKNDATDADWLKNGAGFNFSHRYGAGFVDAAAAVALARTWTNLGTETSATQSSTTSSTIPDNTAAGTTRAFVFSSSTNLRVETLEVAVSVTHANRGQLRFELTSPAGTRTVLGEERAKDTGANFTGWTFSSPRHWGEAATGTWTLRVIDTVAGVEGTLTSASVTLYGAPFVSAAPAIATHPAATSASVGGSVTLSVSATGTGPFTYQWRKDGAALAGQTGATLTLSSVAASDAGSYSVVVTNALGSTPSNAAALTVSAPSALVGRISNLSILTDLNGGTDSFTLGYVVGNASAAAPLSVLIRAAGPALGALGVPGTVADPKLELFVGSTKSGENDDWRGTAVLKNAMASVGAFPFASDASLDAATLGNITTRDNSIKVSASDGGKGTVIAEIYDATPSSNFTSLTPRLINVSVIKPIGSGFTMGFVIGGVSARTVLIRAVGPGLAAVGVASGFVSDPRLTLFAGSTEINKNEDWGGGTALTTAFGQVGAFNLPLASRDAALVATLQPGSYSVQVAGPAGAAGIVLVEVYEVP